MVLKALMMCNVADMLARNGKKKEGWRRRRRYDGEMRGLCMKSILLMRNRGMRNEGWGCRM